ncbi:MAG: hypothetical protein P8J01_02210, partial [Acidimicrobiales bacterium]|nr:hypothetical protein [Acidimicrobiales bacterium]
MRNSKLIKLLSLIFTFALIAAACGGDDADSGSSSSSDNSAISDDSAEEEAEEEAPAAEEEAEEEAPAAEEEAPAAEEEAEEAGEFSDAVNGDGSELLESVMDAKSGPADDSLDAFVVTMSNIEGTPVGSFPEIREGAAAAAKAFNENYGGMNGRSIDFQPCVHGLDPAEATNCANDIADEQPNVHIQGIDFFNPLMWPTIVASG